MAERTITWGEAKCCGACKVQGVFTPTTHSVTDSQQLPDGSWQETGPRFGCAKHTVVPRVLLLDGTSKTFEGYVIHG